MSNEETVVRMLEKQLRNTQENEKATMIPGTMSPPLPPIGPYSPSNPSDTPIEPGNPAFWELLSEKATLEVLSVKNWIFGLNVLGDILALYATDGNLHTLIPVGIINALSGLYIVGKAIVDASGNGTTQIAKDQIYDREYERLNGPS
jgi:hypothetical protein